MITQYMNDLWSNLWSAVNMRWNVLCFALDMNFVSDYSFCWVKLETTSKTCSRENIMLLQSTFFSKQLVVSQPLKAFKPDKTWTRLRFNEFFRQFIHCRCWWFPILKINHSIKHGLKIHSQDPTSVSTIKMLSLSKPISKPICAHKNTFASASSWFKAVRLTMIIAIIIIIFII